MFSKFPVKIPIVLFPKLIASSIVLLIPSFSPYSSKLFFILTICSSKKSGNAALIPIYIALFIVFPKVVFKKFFCSFSNSILLLISKLLFFSSLFIYIVVLLFLFIFYFIYIILLIKK